MPKLTKISPTERHKQFRSDLIAVMRNYEDVPAVEALCVVSYLVGQLVALQDQTKFTPEQIMAHVSENIALGNSEAINELFANVKGKA